MAMHYTKKKDEEDEKTVSTTDFMNRVVSMKLTPEEVNEAPKIESPK